MSEKELPITAAQTKQHSVHDFIPYPRIQVVC